MDRVAPKPVPPGNEFGGPHPTRSSRFVCSFPIQTVFNPCWREALLALASVQSRRGIGNIPWTCSPNLSEAQVERRYHQSIRRVW